MLERVHDLTCLGQDLVFDSVVGIDRVEPPSEGRGRLEHGKDDPLAVRRPLRVFLDARGGRQTT